MKYAPKKVFIKENEKYIEITNEEHERRKTTDEQYSHRRFIPLQGYLLEVDEAFYTEYYREEERNKYITMMLINKRLVLIWHTTIKECSLIDMFTLATIKTTPEYLRLRKNRL